MEDELILFLSSSLQAAITRLWAPKIIIRENEMGPQKHIMTVSNPRSASVSLSELLKERGNGHKIPFLKREET